MNLYNAYDTKQAFSSNYDSGVYSYLTPYLSHGRYFKPLNLGQKMKLTKIYLKKFSRVLCLAIGFASAFTYSYITQPKPTISKLFARKTEIKKLRRFSGLTSDEYTVTVPFIHLTTT